MSIERAKELLKKAADDPDFRQQLTSARDYEEKRQVIQSAGFTDVTKEDMAAAAPSLQTELSEEDLEAVAGGTLVEWVIAVSTVSIAAATAAA